MCASNRLKDLPALPDSIKHIDLAGNRLVHVPKPLEKLKNMQILDLSGNYAMNAEKAFASADLSGCAALQQLALIGVPHSLGVTVVVHSRVGPRSVKMDKGGFACRVCVAMRCIMHTLTRWCLSLGCLDVRPCGSVGSSSAAGGCVHVGD